MRASGSSVSGTALLSGLVALSAAVAPSTPAHAAPVVAQEVVQPLPDENRQKLSDALVRLGRNGRDLDALIDAGDAARGLGDFDAAIGFYKRAEQVSGSHAKVKAGLARAYALSGDPVEAIRTFAEAERAGARAADMAADRGLAYDLVGDTASAQKYYRLGLGGAQDNDVRLRLAISQAISAQEKESEATLMPLLREQDKPAWRTRAFALAIGGNTREAVDIVNTILPQQLAATVAPYLRYMPRLTPAQQAAAANLGRFPRAAEIGQDSAAIVAYQRANPSARAGAADTALVPRGEPLGGASASRSSGRASRSRQQAERETQIAERAAPPEPRPAIERDTGGELPPVGQPAVTPAVVARTTPAAPTPSPAASTQPVRAAAAPTYGPPAATPPASAASAPAQPVISLAEVFSDLGVPDTAASPAVGAVDISRIRPARPAPPPEPKPEPVKAEPPPPPPPSHPSRIWVQLGIGRDKDAIAFDWRRYTRQAPELLKGKAAHITEFGRTNRILAGPFASRGEANRFVAELGKADVDGMIWTSPAGQPVAELKD